jgi:hypothetical protein
MKAKASSRPNRSCDREGGGLSQPKKRRGPVFSLTREQVFQKCRAKKHRLICAGEVLALMDLMELRGWSILELAEKSLVSRQMISAMLNLERFPTSEVVDQLACPTQPPSGYHGLRFLEEEMACGQAVGEIGRRAGSTGWRIRFGDAFWPPTGLFARLELGIGISEVGIHDSGVGFGISEVGIHDSGVGFGVSEVGIHDSEVGFRISGVGEGDNLPRVSVSPGAVNAITYPGYRSLRGR